MVETQAHGGLGMTTAPCRASAEKRAGLAPTSWLATQRPGRKVPSAGAVFLHAPSFAFQAPGGGENQLIQTGMHLEDLGVPVRLFSPWTDRLETARLLHLFGMSREGLELARVAQARRVPVVLSPICWYEPRALAALEHGPVRKLASLAAWGLRSLAPAVPSWRRELLRLADLVLPNSRSEANQLIRLFGVPSERIRVVPNGVLPSVASASPELFHSRWGAEPFVLFVGRIEPRKNTLGLIKALRGLGLPLVVIGEAPPGCEDYERECRRAGAAVSRGWAGSTITIRSWPRPTRRRGSLPCRAGSRRRDWPRSRPASRAARSRSRRTDPPETTSATWCEYARPDRVGGDSASRHEMLGRRSRPSVVAVDRDSLSLAQRGPDHRGGL